MCFGDLTRRRHSRRWTVKVCGRVIVRLSECGNSPPPPPPSRLAAEVFVRSAHYGSGAGVAEYSDNGLRPGRGQTEARLRSDSD